ncbi:unnamed protein product, partial [Didymodactylos carnosus]
MSYVSVAFYAIYRSSVLSDYANKTKIRFGINRSLESDCRTRWNSTHRMLETFLLFKNVISSFHKEKSSLKLRSEQRTKLSSLELDTDAWSVLEAIEIVLRPFNLATDFISGRQYPTIGASYHAIHQIKEFLEDASEQDTLVYQMKILLLHQLEHYFFEDQQQLELIQ